MPTAPAPTTVTLLNLDDGCMSPSLGKLRPAREQISSTRLKNVYCERFHPADPLSQSFRSTIDSILFSFLDIKNAELTHICAPLSRLADLAESYCAGGKRLRPAFCYWGWRAASADALVPAGLLAACAGFELLHAGILAHDDVLDGSDLRRGLPSAHRAFESDFAARHQPGDAAQQYGKAQAVIFGDELICWADELVVNDETDPAALSSALPYWRAVRTEVNAGQFLDMANQHAMLDELSPLDAARLVLEIKTSRYTVTRPLQFGAAIGGASEEFLAGLAEFGNPLGRAFQLRDDLLGVLADAETTGKPAGDDLREGKATVLLAEALASSPEADELRSLVGKRDMDASALARARKIITDSGAVAVIEAEIASNYDQAMSALNELGVHKNAQIALTLLAQLCVNRDR